MKKSLEYVVSIVLALITIASLKISLDTSINSNFDTGNSIIYILLFAIFCVSIYKALQVKEKRLVICTLIISILFSLFEVIGFSIDTTKSLDCIISSKTVFLNSIIKFIGIATIIYIVILFLYEKVIPTINQREDKTNRLFNNKKSNFFILWGIIMLAWLPYFLKYCPAIITPDSLDQIYQTQGINVLSNHHPVFHTFIIAIALNIGKLIGNYNIGVAIFTVFQMLTLSAIFAFILYTMSKKNINNGIKIGTFIFFAFYPIFGMYSITIWKDIPFAIVMLLFILQLVDLIYNEKEFLHSRKKMIFLIISMILVIMLRNNGIYVVLLTIPFLLWFYRKNIKKLLPIAIIPVIFYLLYTGPVFKIFNIKKGSVREALSIPLQQFVRVLKDRGSELTDKQKQSIYNFLPEDDIVELYDPTLSDPVKACFDDEYFSNNKFEFITTWAGIVFGYPVEVVEAFLCNNYGYWYPEASNWVVSRVIMENELGIKTTSMIENKTLDFMDELIDNRDIPVISFIFSIGFMFWIDLICVMYMIYKKQYKKLLVFIPIFAVWLTTIASPVFCEYRYVFSMVVTLPIIIASVNMKPKENKED